MFSVLVACSKKVAASLHFLSLKKRSFFPSLVLMRKRTFPAPHWKILSICAPSSEAISPTTERTSNELISFFMATPYA